MSHTRCVEHVLLSALLVGVTATACTSMQGGGAAVPAAAVQRGQPDMAPTNGAPNPYKTIEGWAKMPAGRTWGSTSAVDIDKDGVSIWVAERCGVNTCRDSLHLDPIMKFDANGNMVTSFGRGMIMFPHGIHVDRDGNVWVTDGQDNRPPATRGGGGGGGAAGAGAGAAGAGAAAAGGGRAGGGGRGGGPSPDATKGHQIFKFSPDGRLLMTLGKAAGGLAPDYFYQPNDILVAPNGEIYVAEGHGNANDRILKFSPDGRLLVTWGQRGAGPLEFNQPHALAMDSQGRLFVADRGNNRIQILDQTGKLLDTWYQFSRISGLWIDPNDVLYAADSESGSVGSARERTWQRGIRVGSARTGEITAFIPDPAVSPPSTSAAEGVAVDRNGVVYGAEVGPRALKRYVKQ